jgi:putative protease
MARKLVPEIELHLSTQANSSNWASLQFWAEQGIKRVVLGRELSLEEIRAIREKVDTELEVFIHGAMCLSYSGRCYLSRYFNDRDANQGDCSQPCRWRYVLQEEKRPGHYLPVEQDERGTYLLSSKDLCLLPYLPKLVEAGIDCFKIEGRMKSIHYVATVVRAYRLALDAYWENPKSYALDLDLLAELDKVSHREYTSAFYVEGEGARQQADNTISLEKGYARSSDFVGLVTDYNPNTKVAVVEQRDPFRTGEVLEIVGPNSPPFLQRVGAMWDENGETIEVARHPQEQITFLVDKPVVPWSLVRRMRS